MVVGEGHLRLVLARARFARRKTIQDIKGKTVGALLGGDPYKRSRRCCVWGDGQRRSARLRDPVVNTPTLIQAAEVPTGMDAADHRPILRILQA